MHDGHELDGTSPQDYDKVLGILRDNHKRAGNLNKCNGIFEKSCHCGCECGSDCPVHDDEG